MRNWTQARVVVRGLLVLGMGILPSSNAWAADGVVEINQASVLAGGVTASDASGFPATLDTAGSYVLTSNLDVTGVDTHGIEFTAPGIHLDLNGFTIQGPITCTGSGATLLCDPGSGSGVNSGSQGSQTVRNGQIRGFGVRGVILGSRSRVEGITVDSTGNDGISLGPNSVVRYCIATRSASNGIRTNRGSVVESSVAEGNLLRGFNLADNSLLIDSTAERNGSDGVICGDDCNVRGITSVENGGDGISVDDGAIIAGATVASHTSNRGVNGGSHVNVRGSTFRNNGVGISLGAFANISDSNVSGGVDGVRVRNSARISGSTISDNLGDGITTIEPSIGNHLHLTTSVVRSNGGTGVIRGNGALSVILLAIGNEISSNGTDLDALTLNQLVGCNRIGFATVCP